MMLLQLISKHRLCSLKLNGHFIPSATECKNVHRSQSSFHHNNFRNPNKPSNFVFSTTKLFSSVNLTRPPEKVDTLLFTCEKRNTNIFYNFIAGSFFIFTSYVAYKIWNGEIEFDQLPKEDKEDGSVVPFYRQLNLSPHTPKIALGLGVMGLAAVLFMVRFTLRSVESLVLLADGKTMEITTRSIFGQKITKSFPSQNVYCEDAHEFFEGPYDGGLKVKGRYWRYILESEGKVLHPQLLRKHIGCKSFDD